MEKRFGDSGLDIGDPRIAHFFRLTQEIMHLPRHLGQHSGGMIVCQGKLDQVVPLEPASMPNRTLVQWDKDDCADLGIVKIDLLGLGMLAVLQDCIEVVRVITVTLSISLTCRKKIPQSTTLYRRRTQSVYFR